jgi:hypothetical protein
MAKWDKALSAATAGLELIAEGDPLRGQLTKVVATVREEVGAVDRRVAVYFGALESCDQYFKRRRIAVGQFGHSWMGNWELSLRFDEEKNQTIWPIVVVYDEVLQVDFVEGWLESTPFRELLAMMIPGAGGQPPPWDTEGRYRLETVIVYVAERAVEVKWGRRDVAGEAGNVEIDPECSLSDVFAQPAYVVPAYPVIGVAVRQSRFARELRIQEKVTKSGRRRVGE